MAAHALIALSQAWTDSIGLIFTWVILLPVVATICVIVAMVSGRGDKSADDRNTGRWGRKPPPGHE
ncbi:MAG: hypothetical protein ACR2LK_11990 [Solirubrobacteraceae bacterium]